MNYPQKVVRLDPQYWPDKPAPKNQLWVGSGTIFCCENGHPYLTTLKDCISGDMPTPAHFEFEDGYGFESTRCLECGAALFDFVKRTIWGREAVGHAYFVKIVTN